MTLEDLVQKTCVIGLSYFDLSGQLIKQNQLCGTVVSVDAEQGISIELHSSSAHSSNPGTKVDTPEKDKVKTAVFHIPPTLSAWFVAPAGHYRDNTSGIDIKNPDFLVTWDIFQTQKDSAEGQHEWWEWVPRTTPPQVNR